MDNELFDRVIYRITGLQSRFCYCFLTQNLPVVWWINVWLTTLQTRLETSDHSPYRTWWWRQKRSPKHYLIINHRYQQIHVIDLQTAHKFWNFLPINSEPNLKYKGARARIHRTGYFLSRMIPWGCATQI